MTWRHWAEELRQTSQSAVTDLLRGAAEITPFERASPHEFLLAVLPRSSRLVSSALMGEPRTDTRESESAADLPALLDAGLTAWLLARRQEPYPAARKLTAYVAQLCEALQWLQYFHLPQARSALAVDRAMWIKWLSGLSLSAYRDPEYEYWRVLAAKQTDDRLQFFWQSFVVEAGRFRSNRYLNLGLLAFAKLPLSEGDSLRNLRLQVQALVNRYQRRKAWGTPALEDLARALRGIMARNPSMDVDNYRTFLTVLLGPLGDAKTASTLSLLGINRVARHESARAPDSRFKLKPPGMAEETDKAVREVRRSSSLVYAWSTVHPLLSAHEDYLRKSGDPYYFVRNLDRCGRALCEKYPLSDPEIRDQLFQWIRLALRVDADDPRLWMLWELALRTASQPQRAQWVLWEMTRRFPEQLPCRVELARMLSASDNPDDQAQAHRLLRRVLLMDPQHLHAYSTIAQLAIRSGDWDEALTNAQMGLQIDSENEPCMVLLAKAYAWRNKIGDLQTAIDHLQRFVSHYPGNPNAERALRNLIHRQKSIPEGRLLAWEDDEKPADVATSSVETDPAWRAFAESIQAGSAAQNGLTDDIIESADRLLPLPQALSQAVIHGQWDPDVLQQYDDTTQQEYPLETRLWWYLQSLCSTEPESSERRRAEQDLQAWIETEARASDQQDAFWVRYVRTHWAAVSTAETALNAGSEWLQELLDRYRPLPAPLLES